MINLKTNENKLNKVVKSLIDGNLIIWIYNAYGLTVNGLDPRGIEKLNIAKGEKPDQIHRPFVSTLPFDLISNVIETQGYSPNIQVFINKILQNKNYREQIFTYPFFCRFFVKKSLNYKPPITKNGTIVLLLHLNEILNKMYYLGKEIAQDRPFILTGSSANKQGDKMAQNISEINPKIKKIASMIVDLRPQKFSDFMAIPMIDLTKSKVELMRPGNFSINPILEAIKKINKES